MKKDRVKPEFQNSDVLENFTQSELTVGNGIVTFTRFGEEAPILTGFGAATAYFNGIRRNTESGEVEYGIGDEKGKKGHRGTILDWVTRDVFFDEWPG